MSWTLTKRLDLLLRVQARSRGGREGGAGPSRESRRAQEQGGGARLRKLDNFLLQLFLSSCATDIVLVTAPLCTAVEAAIALYTSCCAMVRCPLP